MRAALVLGLLCVCAQPAWGQQRPHRTGFWGEIGSGLGWVRIGCGGCEDVTFDDGAAGYLRVGWTLSDKILLAIETFGFGDENFGFVEGDTSIVASNGDVLLSVMWYPWRNGLFLKGGAGIAAGTFTVMPDTLIEAEGVGVGMTFGFGYDIPISRKFALTLNAAVYITAIGDIKLPNAVVDDVIAEVYELSLGFTIR